MLRVSVRVPPEQAERARATMLELSPAGIEETETDGLVELAVYVSGAGEASLRRSLEHEFGELVSEPVEAGWEHRWRSFHRPVLAGGLWIGPPWEVSPPGIPAVVIDPGLAFGTGSHPTTRLCIELLATLEVGSVLDVGCGSGVLAIAAAKLGFEPVRAIDVDPVAVDVALANSVVNDVTVSASVADAATDALPDADVALVNVALPAVEELLGRLVSPRVITSGYLVGERPNASGWVLLRRRGLDGWAADLFERK